MTEHEESKSEEKVLPITDIDKLIHEPARLLILSLLFVVKSADFLFIKRQTDLTFGNLSAHLSKLEEAGYVNIVKKTKGKKTETILSLTRIGREAFEDYRNKIASLLDRTSK